MFQWLRLLELASRRQSDVAANAAAVEAANRNLSVTERRARTRGLRERFAAEYVRTGVEGGVTLQVRMQQADEADYTWRGQLEYKAARSFERCAPSLSYESQ